MSGRCYQITLPDGTKATVRAAKIGWKPSPADLEMIMALRRELLEQRMHQTGGDSDCNHEDDGEGTCLGCGAQL
jgi:hypothetical protein